ncbi:MAG TPA: hypothetical protein VN039_11530 [Nitrospira sp.]|nr:hypothetical protein [Nitrospira sp.]
MRTTRPLNRGAVFLSGSIPDRNRWEGNFDPLEITDAVVAFARACLTRKLSIVTAAHPTLAPLLLYVAAEFPVSDEPQVVIYQSLLFESVLPAATRRFEARGIGELIWTEAAPGEEPVPGHWDASLSEMRERMLVETDPWAAAFIGGMVGIEDEFARFAELFPGRPMYAVRRPGGEASCLSSKHHLPGLDDADQAVSYPTLWNRFLDGVGPPEDHD